MHRKEDNIIPTELNDYGQRFDCLFIKNKHLFVKTTLGGEKVK